MRSACQKFRSLILKATRERLKVLDSETRQVSVYFVDGIAIASVCMTIYQCMFLEEDWEVLLTGDSEQAELENREPRWNVGKHKERGINNKSYS